MPQGIGRQIASALKAYPFKRRIPLALFVFLMLFATTTKSWHFQPSNWGIEPWKAIGIWAFSVAWLFQPRGRWNMFFFGIGVGDVLLAVLR
jgi:hypothetical protein